MWESSNKKATAVVENECPYCHEHLVMNKRSFANHVRWCKSNPRHEEIKSGMLEKLSRRNKEKRAEIKGELKVFSVKCANPKCGREFDVTEYEKDFPTKKKYYCCRSCANSHERTEESKRKVSESVKHYMREHGHTKQQDSFLEDRVCPQCGRVFHTKKVHQICCSHKCGVEYKNRKHYMSLIEGCDDIERIKLMRNIYRKQCSFRFALNDFPGEFEFELIKENGWYQAKNHGNNLKGVSRDHMFSVSDGFKLKIDPYIISHPANCSLMVQTKNSSKHDDSSLTIEELKERIHLWEEKHGIYENKIDYKLLNDIGFS